MTANVDIGTVPNDGDGDPLRTAFNTINNNFSNLFTLSVANNSEIQLANSVSVIDVPLTTAPEVIDVGTLPNDGTGDPLRVAFEKINNNFANLALLGTANVEMLDAEVIQDQQTNILNIGQVIVYNNNYITGNTTTAKNTTYSVSNTVPTQSLAPVYNPYIPKLAIPEGPYGNQEYINIGATPNDGTGDPLRVAFNKINNNFSNLFLTTTNTTTSYTVGLDSQIIFETEANNFTQGQFQISSSDSDGANSQNILINAQIKNSGAGVRWTAYGTTFEGDALTRYDMAIAGGNVILYANPIANTTMVHFIASTITWQGVLPGIPIGLNGYANSVMATEDDLEITTEN